MTSVAIDSLDPRIRRTRAALQQALGSLLESKEFDKISVLDIAEAAGLNRATFYDHFPDKFALLEAMVDCRFNQLLRARGIVFDDGCSAALRGMILGVCDYLASTPGLECERQRRMEPYFESAVIAVVRKMVMDGLTKHPPDNPAAVELIAATASWAIYGAAKEWVQTPNRCPSEEIVDMVMGLVAPILGATRAAP